MLTIFILTVQVVASLIAMGLACALAYFILMMIGIAMEETYKAIANISSQIPYMLGRACRACCLGKAKG